MDSKIKDFHDYIVHDAMIDIEGITSKILFGGYAIYKEGNIFAIIASDSELYFKVDENLKDKFGKYDSHPFTYTAQKKGPIELPYWLLPEEILEDREELETWINESAEVSKKSK